MSHRRKRVNAAAARKPSWRDILPIHPAAELFPLMTPDELRSLGEDILKNGMTSPIVLWEADENTPAVLLDGRNRLDAIELVIGPPKVNRWSVFVDGRLNRGLVDTFAGHVDPYAHVISANIHRRHLTTEQKRELIAKLIKAQPEKSDRQIGEMIKADHKTVGAVRAEKEATGEISSVEKRIGMDGKARKRPAKKNRRRGQSEAVAAAAMIAEHDAIMRDIRGNDADPEGSAKKRGAHYAEMEDEHDRDIELDIYPDNSRNAFLIRVNQVIEFATYSGPVTGEIVAAARHVAEAWNKLALKLEGATTSTNDGLDIPDCLRRTA